MIHSCLVCVKPAGFQINHLLLIKKQRGAEGTCFAVVLHDRCVPTRDSYYWPSVGHPLSWRELLGEDLV